MTPEQKKNTELLIQIIERKIERGDPPEVLNNFFQPCKTYGCVLGDYVLAKYAREETYRLLSLCIEIADNFKREFGFSNYFNRAGAFSRGDVIGLQREGSLKERLDYVKRTLEGK